MRSIANEKLDIIVNLSKLIDAEIRDERGITKIVIPISGSGLNLTEFGNVNLRLSAIPFNRDSCGTTHLVKVTKPSERRKDKRGKDIIGSIYLAGKHEFDAEKAREFKAKKDAEKREKTRSNKYKGIEF